VLRRDARNSGEDKGGCKEKEKEKGRLKEAEERQGEEIGEEVRRPQGPVV
jgi:hypothetical protein